MNFLNNIPQFDTVSDEDKLWEILEQGMYRQQRYIKNNIYASSAHCPRFNALTLNTEVNNDAVPSLSLYAQLGNCIEDFVAESLRSSKRLIDVQYKPTLHENDPVINLSGIIDILYINENQNIAILEVKSTSQINSKENLYYKKDKTVGKTVKKGIQDIGPSIAHKTQAEIYSAITGIRDVSILYLSRNVIEQFGREIAHYIYKVDTSYPNLFKVMNDLYYAQLCNTNNITPNRPQGYRKTIECKYCDLLEACYNDIPTFDVETDEQKEMFEEATKLAQTFMDNIPLRQQMVLDELVANDKLRLT